MGRSIDTWLYTGYWDYRVRNQLWASPDNRTFGVYLLIVDYPRENLPYPWEVGENYPGKMDEIPIGENIYIRARLLLRNLSGVTFDTTNQTVTFKYGGNTYHYAYAPYYEDYTLTDVDATLSQTEGTGEWSIRFDSNISILVDNNAPATGEIFCGIVDFSNLGPFIEPPSPFGLAWIIIVVFFITGLIMILVYIWKKGLLKTKPVKHRKR